MTDPFEDLRGSSEPVAPDPVFARLLRTRLDRALALPRGVAPVTTVDEQSAPASTVPASTVPASTVPASTVPASTVPAGPRPAAVPYLAVSDARAAIDWYRDVFGAVPAGEPIVMPDGRIGHAELTIGDGVLYLSDAHPEIGVTAPRPGEHAVSLMLPVHDADEVRGRAIDRGANGDRPPYDGYGARNAWIVDPFGHRWGLHSPLRPDPAPIAYRPGDLTHVSLCWPDPERAHRFYAEVLGWSYLADGRVDGSSVSIGFSDAPQPAVGCTFAVDDLDRALDRVRAAGGQVTGVGTAAGGRVADCTDDQGAGFALHELPPVADGVAPPVNGSGPGELSYLTLHVRDSARARAFYGSVLGWTFRPGRVEDGWAIDGMRPMGGLAGGHDQADALPMWTVSDVPRAVETVRRNGGTATDPQRQPYGLSSDCVDDQGMRFYLGEA